jgi:hypothetical protein
MLIVHHWDSDGICSAAKLIRALKIDEFVNMSPDIGDFSFGPRIKEAMKEHDEIYVVDLNLPKEVQDTDRKITFIDHHIQGRIENPLVEQINPLVNGKDPEEYPSCTAVISDLYDDWDILSALGAVGDVGDKAFNHPKVNEVLGSSNLTEGDIHRIVALIDANYLAMDIEDVEEAVGVVLRSAPDDLLVMQKWIDRKEDIEDTIARCIEDREVRGELAVIDFTSPYNIISKLARKAVWEMGYQGALVINRDFHGKGQTYFRISAKQLTG